MGLSKTPAPQRFRSFKWKALLLFSLVPILTTGAFTFINYVTQRGQLESRWDAQRERFQQEIRGLVEQSAQRLQQLGSIIPSLKGMAVALEGADPLALKGAFESHWSSMQLDMGLEVARFYDAEGHFLEGWAVPGAEGAILEGEEDRWVRQVNNREMPLNLLDCVYDCKHYGLIPLLAEGRKAGVVVLATSLADVIVAFRKVAGADIGVLVPAPGAGERMIAPWHVKVVALSEARRNMPVLRQAAAQGMPLTRDLHGAQTQVDGRFYEVDLVAMPKMSGSRAESAGNLAVISDVTPQVRELHRAFVQSVLVGGSGLVLSELLLLALLWGPMSRLRRAAATIPLLGESRFADVRSAISLRLRHSARRDELDLLDQTAVALADRLEDLESEVKSRERALTRSNEDLRRERDFVQGLLNTAQVIILTQDRNGRITMLNPYGEQMTGYQGDDLRGQSFIDRLVPAEQRASQRTAFGELLLGDRDHLQQELPMLCKGEAAKTVVWFHSRLPGGLRGEDRVLSVGLDVTESRAQQERIKYLADHDALTGLFNRRRFQDELDRLLIDAITRHRRGTLLFLDLDQFKFVNDTSGHQAGDTLLRSLSEELRSLVRRADVVGRLGGDEFAVAMPDTDAENASRMAEKILRHLSALQIPGTHPSQRLSLSIGLVLFPKHGTSTHDLLANADVAMHQAKDVGRGGWHLFSPDEQARERLQKRALWVGRIEQALAEDRLVLYYQPIMDILGGTVSHYEVLVRMVDEEGEVYSPANFIPLAEHTGLIRPLDHKILKKAIRRLALLARAGQDVRFAVNLSGRTMDDPELLETLERTLRYEGLDPAQLIFEITETAAVADLAAARTLVEQVRALGCRFALDDFGVGFSSFYYLKQLPVDYVKIDGSFIQDLVDNADDQVIVRVLAQIARGFGKKTIAEFVENAETQALLAKLGVDYAQGFYVGRPSPELAYHPQVEEAAAGLAR